MWSAVKKMIEAKDGKEKIKVRKVVNKIWGRIVESVVKKAIETKCGH